MPRIASGGKHTDGVLSVETANNTSHYFIGAPQRPWMDAASQNISSHIVPRPTAVASKTASASRLPHKSQSSLITGAPTSEIAEHTEADPITLLTPDETSEPSSVSDPGPREGYQTQATENTYAPGSGIIQNAPVSGTPAASASLPPHTQSAGNPAQASSLPYVTQAEKPFRSDAQHTRDQPNAAGHATAPRSLQPRQFPAEPDILASSTQANRKRSSDADPGSERRLRVRSDQEAGPVQLPTPQSSPTVPTVTVLTTLLDSAMAKLKHPLTVGLTLSRVLMLREACWQNDVFYVLAHSVYCAWQANRLAALQDLNLTVMQTRAIGIMQTFWGPDNQLSSEVRSMFMLFPRYSYMYIQDLLADPQTANLITTFRNFLQRLATHYERLEQTCRQRNCPPCPHELRLQLSLPSPVLQKLIFRSLVRRWPMDEFWAEKFTTLFEQFMTWPGENPPWLNFDDINTPQFRHRCRLSEEAFARACLNLVSRYSPPPGVVAVQGAQQMVHDNQRPGSRAAQHQLGMSHALAFNDHAMSGPRDVTAAFSNSLVSPGQSHADPQISYGAPVGQQPLDQPSSLSASVNTQPAQMASVPVPRTSLPEQPPDTPNWGLPAQSTQAFHPGHPASVGERPIGHGQLQPQIRRTGVVGRDNATDPTQPLPTQATLCQRAQQASRSPGRALFPPREFVLPRLAIPDPDRHALHQAHLRSPKYNKVDKPQGSPEARYYQYVDGVVAFSQFLGVDPDLVRWTVLMPPILWVRRAKSLNPTGEFLTRHRNIRNGCVQFRLKCVSFKEGQPIASPTLSDFCTRSTNWPQCLSVSINDNMGVDFRRKAHYGVDLPTDVTDLLKEGLNEVVISISSTPAEMQTVYLMAIEAVCVCDHETVLTLPGRIGAKEALSNIVKALQGQSEGNDRDDDDDIVIAQSVLSIDLIDPFTSVVWVTPVRGRECQHRECFDLESFLQSRTSRDGKSGVTNPDQWKCPICKKDARPPMLVIDEFLLEVRKTLEQRNQLTAATAILVLEDGSWEVKLDRAVSVPRSAARADTAMPRASTSASSPGPGQRADSRPAEAPASPTAPPLTNSSTPIVVIDDDDDT